jgi:hypothetical protein
MASLFGSANASNLPMNVLFPEAYEASKREIARDFIGFGVGITIATVALALLLNAMSLS